MVFRQQEVLVVVSDVLDDVVHVWFSEIDFRRERDELDFAVRKLRLQHFIVEACSISELTSHDFNPDELEISSSKVTLNLK